MRCGVDGRYSSDLALLWLWCRLAAAAVIRPLAWELPYAAGAALKRKKKKNYDLVIVYLGIKHGFGGLYGARLTKNGLLVVNSVSI